MFEGSISDSCEDPEHPANGHSFNGSVTDEIVDGQRYHGTGTHRPHVFFLPSTSDGV